MLDLYPIVRPFLFALPPELAHSLTLNGLNLAYRLGLYSRASTSASVEVMGLRFPNRIGIAAGLDKNGEHIDALGALGVGFVEVGTVTPHAQSGNPLPRLFRLRREGALINRMGFPNLGVEALCGRLRRRKSAVICGVNIGKNAATPLDRANDDYRACFDAVYPFADYIALNVSSPNTFALRTLQLGDRLQSLLDALQARKLALGRETHRSVPILVKVAADLSEAELADAARIASEAGIDGIIATNTTVRRSEIGKLDDIGEGGLSGRPLFASALQSVRCIRANLGTKLTIIGVGGVSSASDARKLYEAGADLVQVYTGLIYRGPRLIGEIAEALASA